MGDDRNLGEPLKPSGPAWRQFLAWSESLPFLTLRDSHLVRPITLANNEPYCGIKHGDIARMIWTAIAG